LVDTNVLVDVLEDESQWAAWSVGQLWAQAQVHTLVINPVIYAEISLTFSHPEALDAWIDRAGLKLLEIPRPALFLAGKAFATYTQKGGERSNVLADFFIGAHAAVLGCPVMTRDPKRYRSYFPSVQLVTP
jgi:predicted nucleic acid-binding protein